MKKRTLCLEPLENRNLLTALALTWQTAQPGGTGAEEASATVAADQYTLTHDAAQNISVLFDSGTERYVYNPGVSNGVFSLNLQSGGTLRILSNAKWEAERGTGGSSNDTLREDLSFLTVDGVSRSVVYGELTASDVDKYRFTAESSKTSIQLYAPENPNATLELWNDTQSQLLATGTSTEDFRSILDAVSTTTGTSYSLRVSGGTGEYTLVVVSDASLETEADTTLLENSLGATGTGIGSVTGDASSYQQDSVSAGTGTLLGSAVDGNTMVTVSQESTNILLRQWTYDGSTWNEQADKSYSAASTSAEVSVALDGDTVLLGIDTRAYLLDLSGSTITGTSFTVSDAIKSVSLEGNIAVFGLDGSVLIYENGVDGWQQVTSLEGETTGENFGTSVLYLAEAQELYVGAPGEKAVYVFTQSEGGWKRTKVTPTSSNFTGSFGTSLDVEGDTMVVGASNGVFFFERNASGEWTETDSYTDASTINLGCSVSISGDQILVGASRAMNGVTPLGKVFLFQKSVDEGGVDVDFETTWERVSSFTPSTTGNFGFGISVSLLGDRAVIQDGANTQIVTCTGIVETDRWNLNVTQTGDVSFTLTGADGTTADGLQWVVYDPEGQVVAVNETTFKADKTGLYTIAIAAETGKNSRYVLRATSENVEAEPLTASGVTPAAEETFYVLPSQIVMEFSGQIDMSKLSTARAQLTSLSGTNIALTASKIQNGNQIVWTLPDGTPLPENQPLTLTVSNVQDIQGRTLTSSRYTFTYQTGEMEATPLVWEDYSYRQGVDRISASGSLAQNEVSRYQFTLGVGETASIGLNDNVGGTLKLELYDGNNQLVATGSSLEHIADAYSQHIVGITNTSGAEMTYTLLISCTDTTTLQAGKMASFDLVGYRGATLESENNNSMATATDITQSGGAVGSLPYPDKTTTVVETSQKTGMGEITVLSGDFAAVAGDNCIVLLQYMEGTWSEIQTLEISCQSLAMENGVLAIGISGGVQIYEFNGSTWTPQATFNNTGTQTAFHNGTLVVSEGTSLSFLCKKSEVWTCTQTETVTVSSLAMNNGTLAVLDATAKALNLWEKRDGTWTVYQTLDLSGVAVSNWTDASVQINGTMLVVAFPKSQAISFCNQTEDGWNILVTSPTGAFTAYSLTDSSLLLAITNGTNNTIGQYFFNETGLTDKGTLTLSLETPVTSLAVSGERLLFGCSENGTVQTCDYWDYDYYTFVYNGDEKWSVEAFYCESDTEVEYRFLDAEGKVVEATDLVDGKRYYIQVYRDKSRMEFPYILKLTSNQSEWSMTSPLQEDNVHKSLDSVTVQFSGNIDLTTLETNFRLVTIGSNACTGYSLLDGQTVEFYFSGLILPDGSHTFTIPENAFRDLSGNTASLSVPFTISNELRLENVQSNASATAAPTEISLTFSNALDASKLTKESLQIKTGKETVSSTGYTLSSDGKCVTFTLPTVMYYVTTPEIILTEANFQTVNGVPMNPAGNQTLSLATLGYTVRTQASDSTLKVVWSFGAAISIDDLTGSVTVGGEACSGNFQCSADGKTLTWTSSDYTPAEGASVEWTLNSLTTVGGLPIAGASWDGTTYTLSGTETVRISTAIPSVVVVKDSSSKSTVETSTSVPDSIAWVDEWRTIYVEVWAYADSAKTVGEMEYSATLQYDASLYQSGSSVSFEKSSRFNDLTVTLGSAGELVLEGSNTSALVEGEYVLVGRIRLNAVEKGGISLNAGADDYTITGRSIGLSLSGDGVEDITGSLSTSSLPKVYPVMYDPNDDGVIDVSDLIYFAKTFGKKATYSPQAYFSDYNHDQTVDVSDLILFAKNFGKKVGGNLIFSSNYPDAWVENELVVETPAPAELEATPISQEQLDTVATAAVERASTEYRTIYNTSFEKLTFQVADLGGNVLARQVGEVILVDATAAGYGWYVDATPYDDTDDTRNGEIDLLTVLLHELGHYAGLEHTSDAASWMYESLSANLRKMPSVMDAIFEEASF
ncbi:MAG: matrixin family metalloprotease [Planctomycetia bacterium]|nr:matrixin family metalloprotease [Planctomycetia bacterium]